MLVPFRSSINLLPVYTSDIVIKFQELGHCNQFQELKINFKNFELGNQFQELGQFKNLDPTQGFAEQCTTVSHYYHQSTPEPRSDSFILLYLSS